MTRPENHFILSDEDLIWSCWERGVRGSRRIGG